MKRLFTTRKAAPPVEEPKAAPAPIKTVKKKPRVEQEPIDPQATVVTKQSDAKVVMVIGDFLGSGLAEGLSTAFVDNPHVRVIDRTNGSSGFVRDDFYDWPAKVGSLIDAENPAAIVVMLGANDRQQMNVDGTREAVRSENWNKAYAARAQALAKAISSRKVPFIWVGVPSFKSSRMLLDMLAFNEMFRAAATGAGAEYVDIWDGFVDEDGAYVSNGPDLNGQPARLRAADGINLARPGKRKVAFYAEKPLAKLLGDAAVVPPPAGSVVVGDATSMQSEAGFSPEADAEEPEVVIGPSDLGPIEPGVAVSLRSPALDGGTELLGLDPEKPDQSRTVGQMLSMAALADNPTPGRADDFSWRKDGSTAIASAFEPPQATTGKRAAPVVIVAFAAPDTPMAPLAMITALEVSKAEPAVAPTTLPDPTEKGEPESRAPVVASLADRLPFEDLTIASKGTVALPAPDEVADKSPSRASPTSVPRLPNSSGPVAEGAPTALPVLPVELPPLTAETQTPPKTAPTVVASLEASTPVGDPAPSILRKAIGDIAPSPSPTPRRARRLPTSSGPAANAAPLVPAIPADDMAEPRLSVGQVASTETVPPVGRVATPTDPDRAATGDISPLRAAPTKPGEPPLTLPSGEGVKAPPALVATIEDAAPPVLAPSIMANTTGAADTAGAASPAPASLGAADRTVEQAPIGVPPPTSQPTAVLASLQPEPPALAVPPVTKFGMTPAGESELPVASPSPAEPGSPPAPAPPTLSDDGIDDPAQTAAQPAAVDDREPGESGSKGPAVAPLSTESPTAVPVTEASPAQPDRPIETTAAPAASPAEDAAATVANEPIDEGKAPAPPAVPAPMAEAESAGAATTPTEVPEPTLPAIAETAPADGSLSPGTPAKSADLSEPAAIAGAAPAAAPTAPSSEAVRPETRTPAGPSAAATGTERAETIASLEPKPENMPAAAADESSPTESTASAPVTDAASLLPEEDATAAPIRAVEPSDAALEPDSGKAVALLKQDAAATGVPDVSKREDGDSELSATVGAYKPIEVPATDISSLQSVPPDLMPEPLASEDQSKAVTPVEEPVEAEAPTAPSAPPSPSGSPSQEAGTEAIAALPKDIAEPELPEVAQPVSGDNTLPMAVAKDKPVEVPAIDVSSLQSVPPDLMPAAAATASAAKPMPAAVVEPEVKPGPAVTKPSETTPSAAAAVAEPKYDEKIAALPQNAPEPVTPEATKSESAVTDAPSAKPVSAGTTIIVPAIDISSLQTVPPDLMPAATNAPASSMPELEDKADSSTQGVANAPAAKVSDTQVFPFVNSVDEIPAPRLDTRQPSEAAVQ